MRILLWHVHGSWTTAFVQGDHEYLVPVAARPRARRPRPRADVGLAARRSSRSRPAELRGRRRRRRASSSARTSSTRLAERLDGRRPGRDVPAIYLEHNAPQGRIAEMRHPAADRDDLLARATSRTSTTLFWDCGTHADAGRSSTASSTPATATRGELAARRGRHQRGAPARRA